jgi:hypothetical protein
VRLWRVTAGFPLSRATGVLGWPRPGPGEVCQLAVVVAAALAVARLVSAVVAPGFGVDGASMVVAQGCGVVVLFQTWAWRSW